MITVGGTLGDGSVDPASIETEFVNAHAPGDDIMWDETGEGEGGTSFAAATVAGLAAYWMSVDTFQKTWKTVPDEDKGKHMRDWIIEKSYARKLGGPNIIWNGFDYYTIYPKGPGCRKRKIPLMDYSSPSYSPNIIVERDGGTVYCSKYSLILQTFSTFLEAMYCA